MFCKRSLALPLFTVLLCQAASPTKDSTSHSVASQAVSLASALLPPTSQSSSDVSQSSGSLSATPSPSLSPFELTSTSSLSPPSPLLITSSHSLTTSSTVLPPSTTSTTSTETPHATTTSSTKSTETVSTSTSISPSSLSNFSSSSPSSSPVSLVPDVTPATTLVFPGPTDPSSTSLISAPDPTFSSNSTATAPVTFWKNRAAVAGTFVTTGLASLILAAGAVYMIMRRRERKLGQAAEGEDFFDKGESGEQDMARGASPIPSITQATSHAQTEAYVSRDIHYGDYMNYATLAAYGLDYPPTFHNAGAPVQGSTYSRTSSATMTPSQITNQRIGPKPSLRPSHSFSNSTSLGYLTLDVHEQPSNRVVNRASLADSFYGGIADASHGHAV